MAARKVTAVVVLVGLLAVSVSARPESREEKIAKGLRQIEFKRGVSAWMNEDEIFNLIRKDVGFIDITAHPEVPKSVPRGLALPSSPAHQSEVRNLISQLVVDNIEESLTIFTSFHNRYYTSDSGVESSNWLFNYVSDIARNSSLGITVEQFSHVWKQKSVIARIPGRLSTESVIIGSHQDSINMLSPASGRAPGADDDGSGSMTVLEIFRTIVESGFRPELTLEFHWYSAEEVGLLGSNDIANAYADENKAVRAMLQLDMVGYAGSKKSIGLITDYTSADLNVFIRALITEYLDIGYTNSVCGYGCSDHASWDRVGYHSAFPFEAPFGSHSPYIHTAQDTIENMDFAHVYEFAKLGVAFAVELAYSS